MTRDYAKRNGKRKKSKKSPVYLWLIMLLFFIVFVIGMTNLSRCQQYVHNLVKTILDKKPNEKEGKEASDIRQKSVVAVSAITKAVATHKFDFYNILPRKKTGDIETSYELEIATVKDFAAADHLKAELSLLGFTVSITPMNSGGAHKYTISVGPYDNKDGAIIDQQKLQQNNFHSLLKKIH